MLLILRTQFIVYVVEKCGFIIIDYNNLILFLFVLIYFIIPLQAFIWSDFNFLLVQNIQLIKAFLLIIFSLILDSKIIIFCFESSKQSSNHGACLWSRISSVVIKHYISFDKFLMRVYEFIHLLRFWNEIWILWFLFIFLFTFIDFILSEKPW